MTATTVNNQPADNQPPNMQDESHTLTPGARKALAASIVGTLIEWYDYALYGAAAGLIIAPLFFPDSLSGAAGLSTFATFAVGFLARPLGGVVIGHIGDRFGRKPAMLLTIILMAAATVGIGLLPTANVVGLLAPVLLVAFRFIQGFGAGAELTGAITVVAEYTSPTRRGWFTGIVLSMPPLSIVIATGAFLWASTLSEPAFLAWGWRLPFLASSLLFFVALYIRLKLEETPEYVAAQEAASAHHAEHKQPIVKLLRTDFSGVLLGFLGLFGHSALVYLISSFSVFYLTSDFVGMSRGDALIAVTIGALVGVFTTPIGGWAADKFGAGTVLGVASAVGLVYAYPFLKLLQAGTLLAASVAIAVGFGVVIAGTSGSQGAYMANLFPAEHRFSGMALAREANGAIVAGFSPMIVLALIQATGGAVWVAAVFLAVCCLIAVCATVAARGAGNNDNARITNWA